MSFYNGVTLVSSKRDISWQLSTEPLPTSAFQPGGYFLGVFQPSSTQYLDPGWYVPLSFNQVPSSSSAERGAVTYYTSPNKTSGSQPI